MGIIGGAIGTFLMTTISGTEGTGPVKVAYAYRGKSKLDVLLGPRFFQDIKDKTVIDFGCGLGHESIEMAQRGAARVIGVDIREDFLARARQKAEEEGVADYCTFATKPTERADVVVSLDSFEHFDDPAGVLRLMSDYLVRGGIVYASFGPPWYHPYGGHMFSIFPWAHLVFTERAMLNWRRHFRPAQTAQSIEACGLNKMTVARFERLVAESAFDIKALETRAIRQLRWVANRFTREFCTSVVQCTLVNTARS